MLAPSRFPAGFSPDCFLQFPQLISPLPAVAEEMLPRLGRLLAPPVLIVISPVEALEICYCGRMPALKLVVSRSE